MARTRDGPEEEPTAKRVCTSFERNVQLQFATRIILKHLVGDEAIGMTPAEGLARMATRARTGDLMSMLHTVEGMKSQLTLEILRRFQPSICPTCHCDAETMDNPRYLGCRGDHFGCLSCAEEQLKGGAPACPTCPR